MWQPVLKPALTFGRIACNDLLGRKRAMETSETHLLAAEAWLCRAQDVNSDGGVSYGYSARGGWRPSYPETSGYIATTFLRLGRDRQPSYSNRAERIISWLLKIQNADGSFSNPRYGSEGIVFDTGQVLFGLVAGYKAFQNFEYLSSARRAANWLVNIADLHDRWTLREHLSTPHVYNTRTAWALLQLNEIEYDARREAVARSNLDWALTEQSPSGFYDHCSFKPNKDPFTHTIAYTTRGLLESGLILNERRYIDAAINNADAVLLHLTKDGFLPSKIAVHGDPASASCCLTGNCQFALVWARIASVHPLPKYVDAVRTSLDYVISTQDLLTEDYDIHGAIKGSHPIWGTYSPLAFPNWATKFFVDAMWMRRQLES